MEGLPVAEAARPETAAAEAVEPNASKSAGVILVAIAVHLFILLVCAQDGPDAWVIVEGSS